MLCLLLKDLMATAHTHNSPNRCGCFLRHEVEEQATVVCEVKALFTYLWQVADIISVEIGFALYNLLFFF